MRTKAFIAFAAWSAAAGVFVKAGPAEAAGIAINVVLFGWLMLATRPRC